MGLWKDILKESGWVKDNWKFRVGIELEFTSGLITGAVL